MNARKVFDRSRRSKCPADGVVFEQADVDFCCEPMRRCWGILIGFGVKGHLRSASREVGIFTTHPQANGKTVVGVMPVDWCPFCGVAIEACRVK